LLVHRSASLWPTHDQHDWVLIALTPQECARAERVRQAMQHALAGCLEPGVAIGILAGKLHIYLDGRAIPDHRLASVAVLRSRAGLLRYYGLELGGNPRILAAALAGDFAERYAGQLAYEHVPGYAPEADTPGRDIDRLHYSGEQRG
jgi:hypothetical protein